MGKPYNFLYTRIAFPLEESLDSRPKISEKISTLSYTADPTWTAARPCHHHFHRILPGRNPAYPDNRDFQGSVEVINTFDGHWLNSLSGEPPERLPSTGYPDSIS